MCAAARVKCGGVHLHNERELRSENAARQEKEEQMTELTAKTEKKIRELIRVTEKNLPQVSRKLKRKNLADSPLTESAAKY